MRLEAKKKKNGRVNVQARGSETDESFFSIFTAKALEPISSDLMGASQASRDFRLVRSKGRGRHGYVTSWHRA